MQQSELWNRISDYEFPDGFDAKLTEAGIGWGQSRAREEYRRFVYLTMISDVPVTPSGIVDAVWHVHLSYTRNYWQDFCAKVLKQDLHHDPSDEEKAHAIYDEQYLKTLELYEQEFGTRPPLRIWPTKRLWRRVIGGGMIALVGTVLGLWVIMTEQSGPTWSTTFALLLIFGGGGYAVFNVPSGRPSANGSAGCSGSGGCGG